MTVPYCVASNSIAERVRVSLGATGLLERFEGRMFSADEVAQPKPAPDLFLHAARRMGVEPGARTVIEDSVTGVRAALAAGMTVLGYAGAAHADPAAMRVAGAEVFTDMKQIGERLRYWPEELTWPQLSQKRGPVSSPCTRGRRPSSLRIPGTPARRRSCRAWASRRSPPPAALAPRCSGAATGR
ncbi:MAG: HAD-IA family hydrolase [Betaproteobacteria bacterium]|nr:HAD-IA family hydrolase [Betaproteobacteria bacterium]